MLRPCLPALVCVIALTGCSSSDGPLFPGATAEAAAQSSAAGTGGAGGAGGMGSASGSGNASSGPGGGMGGAGGAGGAGFPPHWDDGTACASEPEVMVWAYDEDTYILRQSLCTNFEGPFLYLLFGADKALLQDTGTGHADVASAVQGVLDQWLVKKGKASIELIVTHSHGHGDHVGGDAQLAALPNTTVVPANLNSVTSFYGITQWPTQVVQYDLGGRILDIIPIPGHHASHIAIYDRRDDLLLTGDTLYPGRLYINDWPAYKASVGRLVSFVGMGNPVVWVLGTHIEMTTTPGDDYPMGANKHPSEHALELGYPILDELNQAIDAMGATPVYEVHSDFIIYPL
jgi:glyoxylase-like metal-dependent hydrolase (beta-lactamase superfamily II)